MMVPAPMTALRVISRWMPDKLCFQLPAKSRHQVALTFDDGPHPDVTPRILDVLAVTKARATFFFQGDAATRHPELVRRALTAGHEIASHGMHHESARRQSMKEALANAVCCHALLQDLTGRQLHRLYRPPYGEMTAAGLRALLNQGFQLAYWNYDSNDSFVSTSAAIEKRFKDTPPGDRAILLFHDDYPITAEALPGVIAWLRQLGLNPTSLGDPTP